MSTLPLWLMEIGTNRTDDFLGTLTTPILFGLLTILIFLASEQVASSHTRIMLKVLMPVVMLIGLVFTVGTMSFSPVSDIETGLRYVKANGKYAAEVNSCIDAYLSKKIVLERYSGCVAGNIRERDRADANAARQKSEDVLRQKIEEGRVGKK